MTISNFFTQKNHLKIAHLLSLRNFFVTQTYFAGQCEKIKGKNYPFLHSPDGAVKCFMQPIKKEEIPWTRENCDSSGYVQTMFPQLPSRRGPRPRPKDYPTPTSARRPCSSTSARRTCSSTSAQRPCSSTSAHGDSVASPVHAETLQLHQCTEAL